jgi:hypothetical protein
MTAFRKKPYLEDFPALGFVPCPGDQESMDAVARTFRNTSEVLAQVNAVLTGADEGEWRGETARAFREMLRDDFQPKDALQSFSDAHRAICDWVDEMADHQQRADALEADAAAALDDRDAARTALEGLPPEPGPLDPEPETDEEREQRDREAEEREGHEKEYQVADAALEELRGRARTLQEDYDAAGGDIADRLRDAMDLAPNEPGFWSSLADAVGDFTDGMSDMFDEFTSGLIDILTTLAPILSNLATITGLLGTICGWLAFVPGLQFLGPWALGLSIASLGLTYLAAVGETGSFTAALTDSGVLMGAAGLALGAGTAAGFRALGRAGVADDLLGGAEGFMDFAVRTGSSSAAATASSTTAMVYATNASTSGSRVLDGVGLGMTDFGALADWSPDHSPVATDNSDSGRY